MNSIYYIHRHLRGKRSALDVYLLIYNVFDYIYYSIENEVTEPTSFSMYYSKYRNEMKKHRVQERYMKLDI